MLCTPFLFKIFNKLNLESRIKKQNYALIEMKYQMS